MYSGVGFESLITSLKKYEINNVLIKINKNKINVSINSSSDIISTYVILKFLLLKTENINSLYTIFLDPKGSENFINENMYSLSEFSLNEFLFFFNKRVVSREGDSRIFEEDDNDNLITGWEFETNRTVSINTSDIKYINEKIEGYRISKFNKKCI